MPTLPSTCGTLALAATLAALLLPISAATAHAADHHGDKHPQSVRDAELSAVLDAHTFTLPVLDATAMSAADRAVLQQREEDVSRAAAFYGFDISDSHWTYHQIVCRTLPDHLMLNFENDSAEHGASHFVAVVPPGGGKVQVVTAYAHGLLPFHAAWEKSTAYEAFNRMTAEDRGEHKLEADSHWLNLGMCFAALSGHVPHVAEPVDSLDASEALVKRSGSTPIIVIDEPGNAEVAFSDVSDAEKTGNWRLRFDRHGRLVKAQLDAVKPMQTRVVPLVPIITPIHPE